MGWRGLRHQPYLREIRRGLRRAATHDRPGFRRPPELVTGWASDRLRPISTRQQQYRPPHQDGGRIYLMSALGGRASKLSDFPTDDQIAWSPDGHVIAAARAEQAGPDDSTAIFVIPVDGGQPRAVTSTKRPAADWSPAFSPDGSRLAYTSCAPACDLYSVRLDSGYGAADAPVRLTSDPTIDITTHLCWSRDGRSVVYGKQAAAGLIYLFRIAVNGNRMPERIEMAGLGAEDPAMARSQDRLGLHPIDFNVDVYRFQPGASPTPIAVSSFGDYMAQFSPDGHRIAFATTRNGEVP